jgi:hypothetical protein
MMILGVHKKKLVDNSLGMFGVQVLVDSLQFVLLFILVREPAGQLFAPLHMRT